MLFGKHKQVVKRILIIEDEPLTAFDTETMLTDLGYEIVATLDDFAKALETNPVRRQQATLPGVIGIPGGVPVKIGDDTIAGIGLSGSPGVDEPCVRAGLAKVQDQLK